MASVMAKRVSVLSESPNAQRPAMVPMRETGIASSGISVARQFCRNRKMTRSTKVPASKSVEKTSFRDALTKTLESSEMK